MTTGSQTLTVNGTSYTILSNGQVANASGSVIGYIDGSGNLVGTNGSIIARSVVSVTGAGFSSGSLSGSGSGFSGSGGSLSGTAGSVISGSGISGSGISGSGGSFSGAAGSVISGATGGFSVQGDGSVINSAGAIIGRVDGSGNIVDTAGNIIGRVTPRN